MAGARTSINESGFKPLLCKAVGIIPEENAKREADSSIKYIIIDMNSATFVNYAGVVYLHNVVEKFMKINVNICISRRVFSYCVQRDRQVRSIHQKEKFPHIRFRTRRHFFFSTGQKNEAVI